jgi:hypothetical protein
MLQPKSGPSERNPMPMPDELRAAAEAELKESLDRYEADLTAQLIAAGRADDEAQPTDDDSK